VKERPDFLKAFSDFNTKKSYRLITLNRSGERIAWLLVLTLGILDAVLLARLDTISLVALIFTTIFLLKWSCLSDAFAQVGDDVGGDRLSSVNKERSGLVCDGRWRPERLHFSNTDEHQRTIWTRGKDGDRKRGSAGGDDHRAGGSP